MNVIKLELFDNINILYHLKQNIYVLKLINLLPKFKIKKIFYFNILFIMHLYI